MSEHSTPPGGKCRARFDPLCELFAAKLASGEDLGASLAVKIDGEMMVDLWGRPGRRGQPIPHSRRRRCCVLRFGIYEEAPVKT